MPFRNMPPIILSCIHREIYTKVLSWPLFFSATRKTKKLLVLQFSSSVHGLNKVSARKISTVGGLKTHWSILNIVLNYYLFAVRE